MPTCRPGPRDVRPLYRERSRPRRCATWRCAAGIARAGPATMCECVRAVRSSGQCHQPEKNKSATVALPTLTIEDAIRVLDSTWCSRVSGGHIGGGEETDTVLLEVCELDVLLLDGVADVSTGVRLDELVVRRKGGNREMENATAGNHVNVGVGAKGLNLGLSVNLLLAWRWRVGNGRPGRLLRLSCLRLLAARGTH